MSTTAELLNRLNVLRVINGERELKSWKESRTKLEQRIALYEQHTPAEQFESQLPPYKVPQPIDDARVEPLEVSKQRKSRADVIEEAADGFGDGEYVPPRSVNDAKLRTVRETRDTIKAGTVTLADIARELSLNPKVLRAKMRRLTIPQEFIVSKHTYKLEHKPAIIDIIKRDHRRK